MNYRVKLNVFEGPFDLLVYLIENAKMSIYDIRISEITTQYVAYVEEMKGYDINLAAEFMVLASELLEIKSRMLLPRTAVDDSGSEAYEDPRTQLVIKLEEYKRFKAISAMLEERKLTAEAALEKPKEDIAQYTGEADEFLTLDEQQFRKAFEAFLQRKKKLAEIREHHIRTEKQKITSEIRIADIKRFFRQNPARSVNFIDLIQRKDDKYDVSVTFTSVLEMIREHKLEAEQRKLFGEIKIIPKENLFTDNEEVNDGRKQDNQVGN